MLPSTTAAVFSTGFLLPSEWTHLWERRKEHAILVAYGCTLEATTDTDMFNDRQLQAQVCEPITLLHDS